MGFYLTALEAGTEGITAEEVSDTIEQMKKPGVVRTYLEGLVPDLLAFLFQVVIACVVYAIGVKLIKLFRKLVRKWLDLSLIHICLECMEPRHPILESASAIF